jgi:hypothetical protein
MDGSRFDAWTRRRFGGAIAGALVAALGQTAGHEAAGKARKQKGKRNKPRFRHRRCEAHRTRCNPHNDRRLCCAPLACGQVPQLGGYRCCARRFQPCTLDLDCCNNTVCRDGVCDIAL